MRSSGTYSISDRQAPRPPRRKLEALMALAKVILARWIEGVRGKRTAAKKKSSIRKYVESGCKPWTPGYKEYKKKLLCDILADQDLLERFHNSRRLPDKYGFRIDERVVEYPWVLSRLKAGEHRLLDAGSALNFRYILETPLLKNRNVVIYNLSPEGVVNRSNLSYIYGDMRNSILRTECFDEIVCISTLEHVGMNNTSLYSKDSRFDEFKPDDYQCVVREFKRLLKAGGKLFITVPYGRYEDHGWLQQFDAKMVETVIEVFGGCSSGVTYFKYSGDGWQIVDADACADCSYFDIHKSNYEEDYVAAARAVACIEMVK